MPVTALNFTTLVFDGRQSVKKSSKEFNENTANVWSPTDRHTDGHGHQIRGSIYTSSICVYRCSCLVCIVVVVLRVLL